MLKVINLIHQTIGFVFLLRSDNLRPNQVRFELYQKNYGSDKIFACNHPILKEVLNLFIYRATQPIYLNTLGTINRQKKSKNWSLKTSKPNKQW